MIAPEFRYLSTLIAVLLGPAPGPAKHQVPGAGRTSQLPPSSPCDCCVSSTGSCPFLRGALPLVLPPDFPARPSGMGGLTLRTVLVILLRRAGDGRAPWESVGGRRAVWTFSAALKPCSQISGTID